MKKILIADSNKSSLVTTSEIFKEKYPGIQICIAQSSQEVLAIAKKQKNFDAFIIDFDLPDQNGAKTAIKLKKISKIPVLITAFDRQDVLKTIQTQCAKFNDCKSFLKKPLHADLVHSISEHHCKGNSKFQKHIECNVTAMVLVRSRSFIVSIVSCSLHTLKFIYPSITQTAEKPLKIPFRDKDTVIFKLQTPHDIECGKKINLDQCASEPKARLAILFPFELKGRIVQHDATEQSYLVEFETVFLAQQIFEAVVREKVYVQLSSSSRLF